MKTMQTEACGVPFTISLVDADTGYFEADPAHDVAVFVSSFGKGWKVHAMLEGVWVCEIYVTLQGALEHAAHYTNYLLANPQQPHRGPSHYRL